MKWRHLGLIQLLSRAVSPFTVVAEIQISPLDNIDSPQVMKVFAVERQGFPEDFVFFSTLCGVQSPPLVFAPSCAFVCSPLKGQSPGQTLCFMCELS